MTPEERTILDDSLAMLETVKKNFGVLMMAMEQSLSAGEAALIKLRDLVDRQ